MHATAKYVSAVLNSRARLERSEIVRQVQSLAPHDHAVLFYPDINTKRALVFPFLQDALENQGVGVYATSSEALDEVRHAMRCSGLNVDKHESDSS